MSDINPESTADRASTQLADHECLNANELAAYLRVNRKTVYQYAAQLVIPCQRLGRRLVFSRAAVAAWLARTSTVESSPAFARGQRQRASNR